jgi:hypothetical protein
VTVPCFQAKSDDTGTYSEASFETRTRVPLGLASFLRSNRVGLSLFQDYKEEDDQAKCNQMRCNGNFTEEIVVSYGQWQRGHSITCQTRYNVDVDDKPKIPC